MLNKTRNLFILMIGLFAGLIVSCAPSLSTTAPPLTSTGSEDMIEPGDMIGEMVVRTAKDESETEPAIWDSCDMLLAELAEAKKVECTVPFHPQYFLPSGVVDSDEEQLNSFWKTLTWEISINGQPIDLDSFGTIDALGGRFWNVVLENPTPGRIETILTVNENPSESYGMTLDLMVAEPTPASFETAPSQAPVGSEDMIKPGATIGEMVVTEAGAWNWETNLWALCEQPGEKVEDRSEEGKVVVDVNCQLYPGTKILLTCSGVTADPELGEDLDTKWPKLKTRMLIDGQEVDLSSFGWIDFQDLESEEQIRTLNVRLENLTQGMHIVFCAHEYPGENTHETTFYFDVNWD